MAKYQWEIRQREREVIVDLVLTCEEEEEKIKKKQSESGLSIVSNTIEHYRTLSNIM